ncbi:DUF3822 family protein [uncultured Winogradskyella sp.]|uniref:DUF3822 family protein n=1 Tax=uncultured Winogradskyella sp. TaxID=395353 RepID=UPI0026192BC9|nr:DUF3822 family protein [uncultured Winogradskyella sp.]
MKNINIKELSIQVNLNGLSFCILNRSTNTVELLKSLPFTEKLTPFNLLDRLKAALSAESRFSQAFNSVTIIHQNELAALVPKELYDENNKADYLKFNAKILKTDFIAHDEIAVNNTINVYIPYVNINNYIYDTFGGFIYKHASTLLIDTLLQRQKDAEGYLVHINVNTASLEIVVSNNNELQLFNVFDYYSKEDFIYYVLFVFEQLNLDPEVTPIVLSGAITKHDELYNILYTYIRDIAIINKDYKYKFLDTVYNEQPHELPFYHLLLNSF